MQTPPPVLDGCRVRKFAAVKRPVRWSGRSGLVIVEKGEGRARELGPVPRLAIGDRLRGPRGFWLLHCDRAWHVLGVQAEFATLAEAEQRAELSYPGISAAWQSVKISMPKARAFERESWKDFICAFCNRIPPEFDIGVSLFAGRSANICSACLERLR